MLIEQTAVPGGIDVLKMRVAQEYISSMDSLTNGNKLILPYDVTDCQNFIDMGDKLI